MNRFKEFIQLAWDLFKWVFIIGVAWFSLLYMFYGHKLFE